MKRVSRPYLEEAAATLGVPIEFDNELNIAVLTVKGQTFYADLPLVEVKR